jgi:hypothetical protein
MELGEGISNSGPVEVEERASIKAWHGFFKNYIAPLFRGKRMELFLQTFAVTDETRIIDLGGAASTWETIGPKPLVTMINQWGSPYATGRFKYLIADACNLDASDNAYEIAFSNSVIEHVGDYTRQQAFAREVRRIAPRYFVQTPYRYFPIEPHYMCLGIQFLPKPVFKRLVRRFSLWGMITKPSRAEIEESMSSIELLTVRQMRELFPDARIFRERFLFLTKSLIAIKE